MKYTYDTMLEKIGNIFDSNMAKLEEKGASRDFRLVYDTTEDGLYFTFDGCVAYFLPNYTLLTAVSDDRKALKTESLHKKFSVDGTLVKKEVTGTYVGNGKSYNVIQMKSGDGKTAYIDSKYKRIFTKQACYYVTAQDEPVIAGWMDGGQLHIIGLIMPVRVGNAFIPNT